MSVLLSIVFLLAFHTAQANSYQPFEENGKMGLKDPAGNILIPARYDAIGWSNGQFSVIQQTTGYKVNNHWGLIHINNRIITAAEYIELIPTESELIIAAQQSKTTLRITRGCLSPAGKTVIPFTYAGLSVHGLRVITYSINAQNQLRYGITDLRHRTILPAVYTYIYPLGNLRFAVQNHNGKTALFSENGQALTDFVIDSISAFQSGRAVFYQNGFQGLIAWNGTIIKPAIYRNITWDGQEWIGQLPATWYILTAQHQAEQQNIADTIVPLPDNRLAVIYSGQVQITDSHFRPQSDPHPAEGIENVYPDNLLLIRSANRFGVLHANGNLILPIVFNQIDAANGIWITETKAGGKSQWYLFSYTGQRISTGYDLIEALSDGYFRIRKNGYEGLLNSEGEEIIPCVYDHILEQKCGLVAVLFRNQYGIITVSDKWVVTPRPHPVKLLGPLTYLEQEGGLTWLKNFSGNALYFTTNRLRQQGEYLIEETTSGGRWTINTEGRIIHREMPATQHADWTGPASEGYRPVRRNGRYGFINEQGLLMIPNRYEDVMPFSEGRAAIKIRNRWGFIDPSDHIVVQPVYEKVMPFHNHVSKVSQRNKWGLIDKNGKVLVPVRYDSVNLLPSGRVLVQSEGYFGLADLEGNLLLHTKFNELTDLDNGMVIVKQNGKYGVTDVRGVALIPVNYDFISYHRSAQRFIACMKGQTEKL